MHYKKNNFNEERSLETLNQRSEEFRGMKNANLSQAVVELVVTSNANVDLGEPVHVTWKLIGAEPSKHDWIGLFAKSKGNNEYYSYQWTGQLSSGKVTFLAPNNFGEYEFRFFHGSNYYEHLAISNPIFVGPIFEMEASCNENNIFVRVTQRLGGVYPKAWVGLFLKGAQNNQYITYEWLGNKTEILFSIPPTKKDSSNSIEEYELRLFALSYQLVAVSNTIQIQRF